MAFVPVTGVDAYATIQSTVLAERGSSVIVINPGSSTLCIGAASALTPLCLPHCIAYHERRTHTDTASAGAQGSAPEDIFLEAKREAACNTVAEHLGVALPPREPAPPPAPSSTLSGERVTYGSNVAWPDIQPGVRAPEMLIGEDALRMWGDEPYRLFWPVSRGRLNVTDSHSLQQVKDTVERIWRSALVQAGATLQPATEAAAVLVVPLTFTTWEVKELVDILLMRLGFESVVVHLEAVAATFGSGISSGCIVHLGHHSTSVCCVEDGSLLPDTWRLVQYGVDDVADVLLWLVRRNGSWPPGTLFVPTLCARDRHTLDSIFDHCFVPMEEDLPKIDVLVRQKPAVALQLHVSKTVRREREVHLGTAACLAPFAYLYPAMLDILPSSKGPAPWLDDDAGDLTEAGWAGEAMPRTALALARMRERRYAPAPAPTSALLAATDGAVPLPQAIVDSICSLPSGELHKRLFMNILVTGSGSRVPGLTDAIEEHTLNSLPVTGVMETVNVVQPSGNPLHIVWRGGALLGTLDVRESWVSKEEWVNATEKCRRMDDLQAKVFIYTTPQR